MRGKVHVACQTCGHSLIARDYALMTVTRGTDADGPVKDGDSDRTLRAANKAPRSVMRFTA